MPQPTTSGVHVDAVLTNVSVAYMQDTSQFIASRVFPVIPVSKKSDKYFTYTKNDWFRDEAKRRASTTESAGSGYNLGTDSYSCDVFAFHKDVGDQERANADSPLDLDRDATEFVTQKLLLRQEAQWAADCFASGIWGTDLTPSALWDNYSTSDPKADVKVARNTILENTGYKPNTLVLGWKVFSALEDHPDIIDRIKYTQGAVKSLTPELLAQFFGVDRVLVASAVRATNVEGDAAAMSFVHGKHALLAYVAPRPSLLAPSAGYTFAWNGVSGGMGQTVGISRFRLDRNRAERIEGETAFDNKIVATDLGYFFNGAVS